MEAFDIREFQLQGPPWLRSGNLMSADGKYVVRATFPLGTSRERVRLMLQELLRQRLRLQYHIEKRDRRVYELRATTGGLKLRVDPGGQGGTVSGMRGHLSGSQATMKELAQALSRQLELPVIDMTQIQGSADFTLDWVPEEVPSDLKARGADESIFTATRRQLGLQLVVARASVDVIVVDHIERDPQGEN
jgi:uncharacterized protein (TIGR03435 family)